jgi:hypothetical protein
MPPKCGHDRGSNPNCQEHNADRQPWTEIGLDAFLPGPSIERLTRELRANQQADPRRTDTKN